MLNKSKVMVKILRFHKEFEVYLYSDQCSKFTIIESRAMVSRILNSCFVASAIVLFQIQHKRIRIKQNDGNIAKIALYICYRF